MDINGSGQGGGEPAGQVEFWRSKAQQLAAIARVTDGLVYILAADPADRWTVVFVDGTLPVEHPYRTDNVGGRRIEDIVPREVFQRIRPALHDAFQGLTSMYEVEYSPGRWLLGTVKPFRYDAQGAVIEVISSNGDVTARKMAEADREEQRARLEALVTALPDLVFIFDLTGVFVGYNISHEENLLVAPSQFIGASLEDIMPQDVAIEARRVLNLVALTGCAGEFKYSLTVNGVEQFYHSCMVRLGDDKIIAVVRNITDLVRAVQDERAASVQLDIASKVAGLAYWAWETATRVLHFSPEVFRMLRIEGPDVPPMDGIATLLGADVLARIRAVGLDAISSGEMKQIEFSFDRGGEVRYFLTSMQMSGDAMDGSGILRGAIQEITEVRRLEAQLLQAQKMESIGRFAGAIAHDFNNMLQVIRGYAEVTRKAVAGVPNAAAYVESIVAATERAGDLVSRILAFSRQSNMSRVDIAVDEVVGAAASMIEPLIGKSIGLDVSVGCGAVQCSLDRAGLEQVLVNLAINARDAMPGGGTVRIVTAPVPKGAYLNECRITWPWLTARAYVSIDVIDGGTGIPDAIVDRIFEPFFTTKAPGVGTGIGLSTAYSIVRRHDGVLHVRETGAGGTTFRILIPVSQPA